VNELFSQLGLLSWPLLLCSLLSLTLIVERIAFLSSVTLFPFGCNRNAIDRLAILNQKNRSNLKQCAGWKSKYSCDAIQYFSEHGQLPKILREEVLCLWLSERTKRLRANLPWLALIAVIAPLLGLLGTVLGMIQAFQSLAAYSGPVQPSMVADGLQQAMLTTAVGLTIAVPTLVFLHAFRIVATTISSRIEVILNRANLMLEGVTDFGENRFRKVPQFSVTQVEQ
jgi:biopolymer transport protein ExbB